MAGSSGWPPRPANSRTTCPYRLRADRLRRYLRRAGGWQPGLCDPHRAARGSARNESDKRHGELLSTPVRPYSTLGMRASENRKQGKLMEFASGACALGSLPPLCVLKGSGAVCLSSNKQSPEYGIAQAIEYKEYFKITGMADIIFQPAITASDGP